MSDVIRNAIIKLGIKVDSPTLKVPGGAEAVKQQEALAEATKQVSAAQATAAQQTATQAAATASATQKTIAFAAAEGTATTELELQARAVAEVNMENARLDAAYLRLAASSMGVVKGAAFLVTGYSDSLSALLPYLVATQGLHSILTNLSSAKLALVAATKAEAVANGILAASLVGVRSAIQALDASLGPVGWLVLLVSAAIYSVNRAYRAFVPSQDDVNERLEEQRQKQSEANQALEEARERFDIVNDAMFEHIDLLESTSEKAAKLQAILAGGVSEDPSLRLRAGREQLKLLDEEKRSLEKQKQDRIELIQLRDRELKTAQDALKTEQDKDRALRASIGALSAGEQRRLGKLTTKLEQGETLSKREAIDLQKLGGNAGQQIGEKFLATLDQGLGQRLEKLTGDPLAKRQAEFEQRQKAFNATTGGATAEDAIASVNALNDAAIQALDATKTAIVAKLHELIDEVMQQKLEQSQQRSAARAANAQSAQ